MREAGDGGLERGEEGAGYGYDGDEFLDDFDGVRECGEVFCYVCDEGGAGV